MKALAEQIAELDGVEIYGRVVGVRGLMVEVAGPLGAMSVGARLTIEADGRAIPCEVVGFSGSNALLMPFAALEGVRRGCRAVVTSAAAAVRPSPAWLGRVVDAMGRPIDGKGPLTLGPAPFSFRNTPPPAHARRRVGAPLDLGVRALNTFLTCCRGQRMGIFAGSGVGKSVLLSMMARNVAADVSVTSRLSVQGLMGLQIGHKRPTLQELLPIWTTHDRLITPNSLNIGGGAAWALTRTIEVYVFGIGTVRGQYGAHIERTFAVGISLTFGDSFGGFGK